MDHMDQFNPTPDMQSINSNVLITAMLHLS